MITFATQVRTTMYKSCTAIVLRVTKYNDKSNIVDLYTDAGRISIAVKTGGSRIKSSMRMLFRPLSILRIEMAIRPHSAIHTIREATTAIPLSDLPYNPYKQATAFFLAEFLSRVTDGGSEDRLMFDYIVQSIMWFDNCSKGYANFHLVFLLRISQLLGLKPDTGEYRKGMVFDMQNAVFTSSLPSHGDYLTPDETTALRQLMRMNYDNMWLFRMNREQRNDCLDAILRYYSLHITDMSHLKSIEVLKELFD